MKGKSMKKNEGPKIKQEMRTVSAMIDLYEKEHAEVEGIHEECADLKAYAMKRLSACRFGEDKPTCEKCQVHCYRPDYREKIQKVMRYAGPCMLFHHPVWAIRHLIKNIKTAQKQKRELKMEK